MWMNEYIMIRSVYCVSESMKGNPKENSGAGNLNHVVRISVSVQFKLSPALNT
jgi:hypothetical protein